LTNFNFYAVREVKKSGHVESWVAALEAKYEGKGKPYGRQEFDNLLGDWAVGFSLFSSQPRSFQS